MTGAIQCDAVGRSVTAAYVRTTVVGLEVSHSSCLSCSSAVEVQRLASAAWESHTGEAARPRASAVLSSRQWLSGGRAGLRAAITPPSTGLCTKRVLTGFRVL
jgi:hypothetical protein